ncbi:MAG: RpiB/LacA/LacB family sugar-phosphate isomerase [Bacilli bacterium]|nr:RpiB/LacA/LacB family sugar-phosphate isomerase [Bacilli bacterium]MDD4808653.1 RpiB/LacA/LacB family sugar-phosphate isomerase [Bacilli bacterium]
MKVGIASDHRGVKLKKQLINYLVNKQYEVMNYGTNTEDSVDHPLYAFAVGRAVRNGELDCGILICGTGIGMSIAANKVSGVRCAKVDDSYDARMAKFHNNANMISISSKTPLYKAKDMVDAYLRSNFKDTDKYRLRNEMIDNYHD